MKILISAEDYPTKDHPFASFVGEICREFTRQGNNVTVIAPQSLTSCIKKKRKFLPIHSIENVLVGDKTKVIEIYRPYYFTLKKYNIFKKASLLRIAKKLPQPDICYAHFWTSANRIVDYSSKWSIPLFVATGEDVINLNKRLSNERISFIRDNVTGVICVSTKNLYESIECGFTSKEQCIVIPNAVNDIIFYKHDKIESRKKLGLDNNDFIVAFVGRFDYRKGANRVSQAIESLNDNSIKSIFIGKPSEGENEIPSCKGIVFYGPLPHEKIPLYLSAADVFVLPSLAEGCSNSIVEAMACGLPIISSDLSFNHDILDSNNSFLIDPKDISSIAKCIKRLKTDIECRNKLAECALDTASELILSKRTTKILTFIRSKLPAKKNNSSL